MNNPIGGLRASLIVAPFGAAVCMGASWAHYLGTGGLQLAEFPRDPVLTWMRFVAALGLVLLGGACWRAYHSVKVSDLRAVLLSSLAVHVLMLAALPLFSTDLFSYLAYGELAARGLDPHQVVPSALGESPFLRLTTWANTPSVYGPIADQLMAIAGRVGDWSGSRVWGSIICYKLLDGIFDVGTLLLFYRMACSSGQREFSRGFALLALNPLLAWESAGQAHNDGLVTFFVVAYLAFAMSRKEYLSVASLTLGTLSKFVLAPTLILELRRLLRTGFLKALGMGLFILLVSALCYAPTIASGGSPLASWLVPFRYDNSTYSATSLYTILHGALKVLHVSETGMHKAYLAYVWVGRIVLLLGAGIIFFKTRSKTDVVLGSIVILLIILGTTATLAPWYFVWILPFAAGQSDERWQKLLLFATVAGAPAVGIPYYWLILPVIQVCCLLAVWRWVDWGGQLTSASPEVDA